MDERFQIRHKEFGVYQGSFLGLGFWHPMSDVPEQGYCAFEEKDAQDYVKWLCSLECADPLNPDDLSIEPFNKAESDALMAEGQKRFEVEYGRHETERCFGTANRSRD